VSFKSKRISQTQSIILNGSLDKVFPLFGPIKEKEWADGWNPEVIYSTSNLVEEKMVFTSKAIFPDEPDYTWVISKFQPESAFIEYLVFTQERFWIILVKCAGKSEETTIAKITYTYTGLTENGNSLNELALEKMYSQDLRDWEKAINYYLETGKCYEE
jgi:hypothetical protein